MKNIINWFEIPVKDINRAAEFYNGLLDLNMKVEDCGEEKYAFFPEKENQVGGFLSYAPGFKPSIDGVIIYFDVERELDSILKMINSLGGEIIRTKTKVEAEGRGYFALIKDTEGNRIGLYSN